MPDATFRTAALGIPARRDGKWNNDRSEIPRVASGYGLSIKSACGSVALAGADCYREHSMRSLFPYVAVLMVYLMTPGAGEIVENVVHLAMSGHTAHAIEDEDHEPTGDEHGCSGSFHVCQCHSSALFMVGTQRADVASEAHATDRLPWGAEDARADGYLSGLFRPPIA